MSLSYSTLLEVASYIASLKKTQMVEIMPMSGRKEQITLDVAHFAHIFSHGFQNKQNQVVTERTLREVYKKIHLAAGTAYGIIKASTSVAPEIVSIVDFQKLFELSNLSVDDSSRLSEYKDKLISYLITIHEEAQRKAEHGDKDDMTQSESIAFAEDLKLSKKRKGQEILANSLAGTSQSSSSFSTMQTSSTSKLKTTKKASTERKVARRGSNDLTEERAGIPSEAPAQGSSTALTALLGQASDYLNLVHQQQQSAVVTPLNAPSLTGKQCTNCNFMSGLTLPVCWNCKLPF
jgi:hypothetical protein